MALPDPLGFTINSVARNLVRVNQDQYSSEYRLRSATDEYVANVRHTSRLNNTTGLVTNRHNVELVQKVFPVSPAVLTTVRKAYLVFEHVDGDTIADPQNLVVGFAAFFTAANVLKLMGWES